MNMLQKFHPMSNQDLVMLGLNDVAYIRTVPSLEGQSGFAIHAAASRRPHASPSAGC